MFLYSIYIKKTGLLFKVPGDDAISSLNFLFEDKDVALYKIKY